MASSEPIMAAKELEGHVQRVRVQSKVLQN
jgi:hypothetical protein